MSLSNARYVSPEEATPSADVCGMRPDAGNVKFLDMGGAYQKTRTLQYQAQDGDWVDKGFYQFCILITHAVSWTCLLGALVELSVQEPSQIAMDFLEFPLETWRFSTRFGLTGWVALLGVNTFLWVMWFAITSIKACTNRYAVKYQKVAADKSTVSLPYPPLRMTVTWTLIVMIFWASAVGYASDLFDQPSTNNAVIQMAAFDNLMWFTIASSIFTSLEYTNRIFRWILDSSLWCCGSDCYDC